MKHSDSKSFVLTLKLNTTNGDDVVLRHRFHVASIMKNKLVSHARKALSSMRQDPGYRTLMVERKTIKDKNDPASKRRKVEIGKQLAAIRLNFGLSEYQLHAWISVQQHRYRKDIDSMTAQKIATSVWMAVETVLFRKGKTVHFRNNEQLLSVEGKNNASGIRFKEGRMHWLGLKIQPQIRKDDIYAREALTHRVKYCRIFRMAMGTTWHWYLQLILEGKPPVKHDFLPGGRVGIDPGVATEAVVSDNGCILTELSPERPDIERQVSLLQRKLDRSRRANNPENFNPDGTLKPKQARKRWKNSKTYHKTRMRLGSPKNASLMRSSVIMAAT